MPANSSSRRSFRKGFWNLADPKISLASLASMFLGACAAAAAGPLHAGWLAVTVAGILALEIAKNASGEIFDFDSGTDLLIEERDRSPFSGGKRVLVDGLLSRGETIAISAASYGVGLAAGLAVAVTRAPSVLWIVTAGAACAYLYHAPPLKLAYRGLGELAVAVCYGPLIASGTYIVQRGDWNVHLLLASIPLGLLIAAFLWINEFPDYLADRAAGKKTLVVRLGRRAASRAFALLLLLAFATLACLPLMGLPIGVCLGALGLVPAIPAARRVWLTPEETSEVIPAQGQTLLTFLLYALGAGVGLLID